MNYVSCTLQVNIITQHEISKGQFNCSLQHNKRENKKKKSKMRFLLLNSFPKGAPLGGNNRTEIRSISWIEKRKGTIETRYSQSWHSHGTIHPDADGRWKEIPDVWLKISWDPVEDKRYATQSRHPYQGIKRNKSQKYEMKYKKRKKSGW